VFIRWVVRWPGGGIVLLSGCFPQEGSVQGEGGEGIRTGCDKKKRGILVSGFPARFFFLEGLYQSRGLTIKGGTTVMGFNVYRLKEFNGLRGGQLSKKKFFFFLIPWKGLL